MNLAYKHLIPEEFSPSSRVWIYQSPRIFSLSEALSVEKYIDEFISGWQSHGTPVKGYGTIFFGQFIILMADEEVTGVSGCSTDSSVRLIKSIQESHGVNLFDRTTLAFCIREKIELIPMNQLDYALENGFIGAETTFLDNTVQNKHALLNEWFKPVKDSWIGKRYSIL